MPTPTTKHDTKPKPGRGSAMANPSASTGFTLVELVVVIAVIGILATITAVSYVSVRDRAKTDSGQALATQVAKKAETFWSVRAAFPTTVQIKAWPSLVPEATVEDASLVLTGNSLAEQRSATIYQDGTKVLYRLPRADFGCVVYWDYSANTNKAVTFGDGAHHTDCD